MPVLEQVAIAWLRDLFGLPDRFGGVLTTGATTANTAALAAARQWWGERHGVDIARDGWSGLPAVPVLSSGYIHTSALKALATLGIGRERVQRFVADDAGGMDVPALEAALRALDGKPALILATVGDVNDGEADPIPALADLAERHGAWLHVDGAFGLFARISPRTAHLAEGVERADSVIADGHKWLNVPYDTGFAFVARAGATGPGVLDGCGVSPTPGRSAPELRPSRPRGVTPRPRHPPCGRRSRAYGREGYRALVERHLDLTARLAARVRAEPDLELLSEPVLNVVAFRVRPPGVAAAELDALNRAVGADLIEDGRVYAGTTTYRGVAAFRPAIAGWRITEREVDLLVDVIVQLARRRR